MGYPTGEAPVQLLKQGDFKELHDLGFDVGDWSDFEFQLIACRDDLWTLTQLQNRLSRMPVTEQNQADISNAKVLVAAAISGAKKRPLITLTGAADLAVSRQKVELMDEPRVIELLAKYEELLPIMKRLPEVAVARNLLRIQLTRLSLNSMVPADAKGGVEALIPADAVEPKVSNYAPAPKNSIASPSNSSAANIQADAKDEVDPEEAEFNWYTDIERVQDDFLRKTAAVYLDKVFLPWKPSDPLPSPAERARLRQLLSYVGFDHKYAQPALLRCVVYEDLRPGSLAEFAKHIFDARVARHQISQGLRDCFENRVGRLNPQQLKQLLLTLSGMIDAAELSPFLTGLASVKNQVEQLKTRFPLHLFLFPGYSASKTDKQLKAAQAFFAPYGIEIAVVKTTQVTEQDAKAFGFRNAALWGYTTSFSYGKSSKADKEEHVQAKFPAQAGAQAVYVLGDFNPLNPKNHSIGMTWSPDQKVRGAKDSIFIGDGGDYELTLAHELGHLMGGHIGGAHAASPFNLMYETTNDKKKELALYQLVFMKSGPRMKLQDEKDG